MDKPFAEVFDFDKTDSYGQPYFKMDILKKYIKFRTMIRYRNKGIEKSLRFDMVECTEQMFEALPDDKKDLSELKRRLCPNMNDL